MIFNKTKKGSAELYNLTGTWYKANDFTGISEDIMLAQNEVIKLIGKATFDRAHSRYMADEYDPEVSSDDPEDLLVRRVQLPVAYKAMHHFYQRNLVSHEDSGRKVKISENEKLPWAWQIEKDDAVLRDTFSEHSTNCISSLSKRTSKSGRTLRCVYNSNNRFSYPRPIRKHLPARRLVLHLLHANPLHPRSPTTFCEADCRGALHVASVRRQFRHSFCSTAFCGFEGDGDSRTETFGVCIPDRNLTAICRFVSG